MADPKGFLKVTERELPKRRPVPVRIMDWKEVYEQGDPAQLRRQAGRCMDCGIPFCHQGCPLGNLIPEWNDLMWRGEGRAAIERLHATNNFPEFTGRLCPAPCESACVLAINQPAVTIKQVEVSIIDQAFGNGWVQPQPPGRLTGKTVAVVGSGPAGLAAAQQLTRAGHTVAVFERDDRIGGLLRYGIPDFKMEKKHLDLRLAQMTAEGTRFRAGVDIGVDITWEQLRERYDAVVVATGAMVPRDLPIPGRDLPGVHFAMEYLTQSNRAARRRPGLRPDHRGGQARRRPRRRRHRRRLHRHGAPTGRALGDQPRDRQGAEPRRARPSSRGRCIRPSSRCRAPTRRAAQRQYLASTVEFLANEVGEVRAIRVAETEYLDGRRVPKAGTEREIPADLVLLALGFTGPETRELDEQLQLPVTDRGNIARDADYATSQPGVFVAGDAGRGQSLIVWAIAEGRAAAAAVDRYLEGDTELPSPIPAHARAFAI